MCQQSVGPIRVRNRATCAAANLVQLRTPPRSVPGLGKITLHRAVQHNPFLNGLSITVERSLNGAARHCARAGVLRQIGQHAAQVILIAQHYVLVRQTPAGAAGCRSQVGVVTERVRYAPSLIHFGLQEANVGPAGEIGIRELAVRQSAASQLFGQHAVGVVKCRRPGQAARHDAIGQAARGVVGEVDVRAIRQCLHLEPVQRVIDKRVCLPQLVPRRH